MAEQLSLGSGQFVQPGIDQALAEHRCVVVGLADFFVSPRAVAFGVIAPVIGLGQHVAELFDFSGYPQVRAVFEQQQDVRTGCFGNAPLKFGPVLMGQPSPVDRSDVHPATGLGIGNLLGAQEQGVVFLFLFGLPERIQLLDMLRCRLALILVGNPACLVQHARQAHGRAVLAVGQMLTQRGNPVGPCLLYVFSKPARFLAGQLCVVRLPQVQQPGRITARFGNQLVGGTRPHVDRRVEGDHADCRGQVICTNGIPVALLVERCGLGWCQVPDVDIGIGRLVDPVVGFPSAGIIAEVAALELQHHADRVIERCRQQAAFGEDGLSELQTFRPGQRRANEAVQPVNIPRRHVCLMGLQITVCLGRIIVQQPAGYTRMGLADSFAPLLQMRGLIPAIQPGQLGHSLHDALLQHLALVVDLAMDGRLDSRIIPVSLNGNLHLIVNDRLVGLDLGCPLFRQDMMLDRTGQPGS